MASENKSKQPSGGYNWTFSMGTSMTDMRLNPLSGRYDEGYGEDSTMASIFSDLNARGYNGYPMDKTGFYILAGVNTKHYTAYNAQFFRPIASTQVGVRSFYEYNSKSANRGWADGTFSSFMSSYGRINGVPSSASFITQWAASLSPYAVGTVPDAGADAPYLASQGGRVGQGVDYTYGEWSNGYDAAYSPDAAYRAATMAIAGHCPSGGADTVKYALENGLNGLTIEHLRNAAVSYLTVRTRTGIYDEKDSDGRSKFYPFHHIAKDTVAVTYASPASQALALRNAREGIVLLKNENHTLPMAPGSKLGVYGAFANAVNSGIYAVGVDSYEGRGPEAGNSPLESIRNRAGAVHFDLGLNMVTIEVDGHYLFTNTEDGIIKLKSPEDYSAAEDKSGYYFGVLDDGQDAVSLYSYGNGRWLRAIISDPTCDFNAYVGSTTPLMNNAIMADSPFGLGWGTMDKPLVVADEDCTFKQKPNRGLPPMRSGFPYFFVLEEAGQTGCYYIRAGAKVNGVTFVGGASALMDKYYGYYLEAQEYTTKAGMRLHTLGLGGAEVGGDSSTGKGLSYFKAQSDKSRLTFKLTEVEPCGYGAVAAATEDDYAVIFVGQSYLGLSGEGADRLYLDLGKSQIDSALAIAKAYQNAGNKTIAVVYANYPVVVEPLKKSEYVDAILFAGYGGQFGGKATAQVLFGEYAPTGRLVSTWYKDLRLFPKLDEYSIPQGSIGKTHDTMTLETLSRSDINDCITVDMTAADVVATGLTYKYLTDRQTADHVTYPFGYGLSYTSFSYRDLTVGTQREDGTFDVTVTVTNTGSVDTAEVVQLYMRKIGSAYGSAVPVKNLAGFARVKLTAGETKTVTITVDPLDIALWDVNAGKFVVEQGLYRLWAAHDSSLAGALCDDVVLVGAELSGFANNVERNIWEHSFQAKDVHYNEYSKLQTAASAAAEGVRDDIYAVTAKAPGAWVAIPKLDFTDVETVTITAGAPEGISGKVELRLDHPDGIKVSEIQFATTGGVTKVLSANNETASKTIMELGYNRVSGKVVNAEGIHDLYLVFSARDLRIGTILLTTCIQNEMEE